MINKRLINTVRESKKYIAGNVICQWISLAANITMMGAKRWLLLGLMLISFATGLFGMILDHIPLVLILHRVISIALVFFLAIHIFVFHKKLR